MKSWWLEQVSAVGKALMDDNGEGLLDDMAHPINLAGVLYSKLKGSPSLNPKILHELAKLVVGGAETLLKTTTEDYERFHLVVFALIYLVAIKKPSLAEKVCSEEFLSVPMDVKYCAKAYGELTRKQCTVQAAQGNGILLCPLSKTGLQCFQRPDFALEHVLQLKRAVVIASKEASALLGLAMRLRMDMFVETEDQALLLLILGQELGYSPEMLTTLVRNDRNAKFRSFLLNRIISTTTTSSNSPTTTFQQCIARERFVQASKRIKTSQESALLDMYNTTLPPVYFDSVRGYSWLAICVNTKEEQQKQQQEPRAEQQQQPTALPQLMLPKQVVAAAAAAPRERAVAPVASSLTRTLAEKTKPKQLTAVFAAAETLSTPKSTTTSTATQLRNKLRQKN